jgi:hypothetical protein
VPVLKTSHTKEITAIITDRHFVFLILTRFANPVYARELSTSSIWKKPFLNLTGRIQGSSGRAK